jgi:hypothetical protein
VKARPRVTSRDLAIVDEAERYPERSLTSLLRKHHRSAPAFKRAVPTRKEGPRLRVAPPHERRLARDPIPVVVEDEGRLRVVRIRTPNDSQYLAARRADAGVYAAVMKGDDSRLRRVAGRVLTDVDSGRRYRIAGDGDAIRDAFDTGELELEDLHYSGGGSADIETLLAGKDAA